MKRIVQLDLLKFVLAVIIIFHHYQYFTGLFLDKGINFWYTPVEWGYLCVESFFAISGFLCMHLETRPGWRELSAGRKFVLRWERIGPIAFVINTFALVLYWLYYLILGEWYQGGIAGLWNSAKGILLLDFGGVFGDVEAPMAPLNTTWYLAVLLICYAVFYLTQKVTVKYRNVIYLCVIMAATMSLSSGAFFPLMTIYTVRGYIPFFMGVLLYQVFQRVPYKYVVMTALAILVYIFSGMILAKRWPNGLTDILDDQLSIIIYMISPVALCLFGHLSDTDSKFTKLGSELGNLSFYMYLIHFPGMCLGSLICKLVGYTPVYSLGSMISYMVLV